MKATEIKTAKSRMLRHLILLSSIWTILIILLGWLNYRQVYNNSLEMVKSSAIDGFNKDLVYRRWSTQHGGVYVPESEETPANPWLSHIPERDIETPSGKKLTLINPAYMTRQVYELAAKQYNNLGHITSLNPIRPLNAPDDWEKMVLTEFEKGTTEAATIELIDSIEYFRFMRPMITEEGCLKCHSIQGYKFGDIRGGISVSIPWMPIKKQLTAHLYLLILTYGGIWMIGLAGLGFVMIRIQNDIKRRLRIEEKLRKSENKYKSLFENMNQGLALHEIILDSSGKAIDYRFIEANEGFEKMTGLKREDIIGKTVLDVMPKTEHSWIEKYGQVVATGQPIHYEDYASELGRYYKVIAYRTQPKQFAVIISDITDKQLTENEIRLKNSELQKLNSEKDKFFSIIAHDLKSPFNSILGFSELLFDQVKNSDFDNIEKYAGNILLSSQRAMDLLMNLMEWSRSQTGRMAFNPETFDLINIINEVSLIFTNIASQKSILIKKNITSNIILFADRAMISTILRNLVSNAIKFTPSGGKIVISAEQNDKELIISVRDTGIGIPKDSIDKLFRIDGNYTTPGTQNEKGTGLGLILCKEFVEKHNGEIWVESEEGKGSSFYISIPISGNE